MKAKDYAKLYRSIDQRQGEREAVWQVFQRVLEEFRTISAARNAKSNAASLAIVKELDQKWRAICREIPTLNPDGYSEFIKKHMPKVWEYWQTQEIERNLRRRLR